MDQSWQLFSTALLSDYYDIQGGTTAEGIHLGVMGATLQIETRNYGGVSTDGKVIAINPHLPKQWTKLEFCSLFQGITYSFIIDHNIVSVKANADANITVKGQNYSLTKNKVQSINYR
ncbi:trehalose 6-phosphate phosphorylase [Lentilactobacillus kosonis]|uniref:Trehalose 6-phosphate phosphorylase n=1 Tax=Lentilactobacillus kosonis TaxID=2810561 RepID=A0A401FKM9_9LACO|nr:trehalose 6-phosphate phosphorylase [Lentilactobacillus kosonis]